MVLRGRVGYGFGKEAGDGGFGSRMADWFYRQIGRDVLEAE